MYLLGWILNSFNASHPNEFNFFFLENGDEVQFLENAIANGTTLTEPYNNPVDAWFTGCSDLANSYNSTSAQYIIMADFYTEYLKRKYFHALYYPQFSNIDPDVITGWHTNNYHSALFHELGHTVLDQFHTNGCDNIMTSVSNTNRTHLTKTQLNNLHKTFAIKNLHKFVQCDELEGTNCSIKTTGDHSINYPMTVFGNLTVSSGHTLTISNTVTFSNESRLLVERNGKLILDKGSLLTTECGVIWKGIIVEGISNSNQSGAGIVELKSGSSIENAQVAISCNPSHIPWPNHSYYGGLIKCDGGLIKNCTKGIEFMKFGYDIYLDQSYFKNVTFENCRNGVTLWANSGVSFDGCTFTNIEQNAILPLDSYIKVNGSNFDNVQFGISAESTLPVVFSSEIGVYKTNNFLATEEGIRATSSGNITRFKIHNNNFMGGNLGIFMNGGSDFEAAHNDFVDQQTSIALYGTQLQDIETEIVENNISSSRWGSLANWPNNTHYWDNCFAYNENADIVVALGSIHQFQGIPQSGGSGGEAAGNCFSKSNTNDIFTFGSTDPFVYVVPITGLPLCKIPTTPAPGMQSANYLIDYGQDDIENCGSPGSPGPISVKYRRCSMPKTMSEYNLMVNTLTQQIAYLESIVNKTWYQKYLLKKYKDCLKKVKITKVVIEKEIGDGGWRIKAINHLNALQDFQSRIFSFGLLVENNEYTNARTWLNSLTLNTEEIQDFYTIQSINLDYLENRGTYSLSQSNKEVLYALGSKSLPLNGYARSLYYTLTGDRIPLILNYGKGVTKPRTIETEIKLNVNAYPNPIKDEWYNMDFNNLDSEAPYNISISNIQGFNVYSTTIKGQNSIKIDVSKWPSGIYIYHVKNERTKEIIINKFIKL